MPLAKMELAKYPTDDPITYPSIHFEDGIAWRVAKDTFISRRRLSEGLLELVELIQLYASWRVQQEDLLDIR